MHNCVMCSEETNKQTFFKRINESKLEQILDEIVEGIFRILKKFQNTFSKESLRKFQNKIISKEQKYLELSNKIPEEIEKRFEEKDLGKPPLEYLTVPSYVFF